MKVLVTGTSGFVGSAIAQKLSREGFEVHGLSRSNSRPGSVHKHHSYDLSQSLTFKEKFDHVVHCAALSTPWASPKNYFSANVKGTENLLKFCTDSGQPSITFISTSSVPSGLGLGILILSRNPNVQTNYLVHHNSFF